MSEAIREAFEALEELASIASDHPGIPGNVYYLRDTVKAAMQSVEGASGAQQGEVPDELRAKALDLCAAVENENDLPPVKYALKCGRLISELRAMLTAAPSGDANYDWLPEKPTNYIIGDGATVKTRITVTEITGAKVEIKPDGTFRVSGDAKREAEIKAEALEEFAEEAEVEAEHYRQVEDKVMYSRAMTVATACRAKAARLCQSDSGDDSEGVE